LVVVRRLHLCQRIARPVLEKDDHSLVGASGTNIDEPNFANNGSHLFQDKNPRTAIRISIPTSSQRNDGQFGNVRPMFFTGPGINNFDMRCSRTQGFMKL